MSTVIPANRTMQWRSKQIAKLGADEFRRQESAKRKARRDRAKAKQKQPSNPEEHKKELQGVINMLKQEINKPRRTLPEVRAVIEKRVQIEKSRVAQDCQDLLEQVFKAKLLYLEKSGKKPILKKSVKQQLKKVTNLHKAMTGKESDCTDFEWTRKTEKVIRFIKAHWDEPNTRSGQTQALSSILVAIEGYEDEYRFYSNYSSRERKKIDKRAKSNTLSDKERKNYLTWPEFKKILPKVKDLRDRALIGIYTLMPPRRVEDISLLKLWTKNKDTDDKFNYLEIRRGNYGEIEYNRYKTAKVYNTISIAMPKRLQTIMKAYIKDEGLSHGDLLFPSRSGKPYKNFSVIITKAFAPYTDKKVTANLLRHSFISNYLRKPRSEEDRGEIALQMGHSISTQQKYLRLSAKEIEAGKF